MKILAFIATLAVSVSGFANYKVPKPGVAGRLLVEVITSNSGSRKLQTLDLAAVLSSLANVAQEEGCKGVDIDHFVDSSQAPRYRISYWFICEGGSSSSGLEGKRRLSHDSEPAAERASHELGDVTVMQGEIDPVPGDVYTRVLTAAAAPFDDRPKLDELEWTAADWLGSSFSAVFDGGIGSSALYRQAELEHTYADTISSGKLYRQAADTDFTVRVVVGVDDDCNGPSGKDCATRCGGFNEPNFGGAVLTETQMYTSTAFGDITYSGDVDNTNVPQNIFGKCDGPLVLLVEVGEPGTPIACACSHL